VCARTRERKSRAREKRERVGWSGRRSVHDNPFTPAQAKTTPIASNGIEMDAASQTCSLSASSQNARRHNRDLIMKSTIFDLLLGYLYIRFNEFKFQSIFLNKFCSHWDFENKKTKAKVIVFGNCNRFCTLYHLSNETFKTFSAKVNAKSQSPLTLQARPCFQRFLKSASDLKKSHS
jgi:hypothetical protein